MPKTLFDASAERGFTFCRALAGRGFQSESGDRYPTSMDLLKDLSNWKPRPASALPECETSLCRRIKKCLGHAHPQPMSSMADKLVDQAISLSKQAGKLGEAADLMEEAFNKWPSLRSEREHVLKLWRRGIVT